MTKVNGSSITYNKLINLLTNSRAWLQQEIKNNPQWKGSPLELWLRDLEQCLVVPGSQIAALAREMRARENAAASTNHGNELLTHASSDEEHSSDDNVPANASTLKSKHATTRQPQAKIVHNPERPAHTFLTKVTSMGNGQVMESVHQQGKDPEYLARRIKRTRI